MSTSTTTAPPQLPTDYIIDWAGENIPAEGVPSPEVLEEVSRALHSVQEFMLDPIKENLKGISEYEWEPAGRIPEDNRPVSYADIGQLVVWLDGLRKDYSYMADTITAIGLLIHEDLAELAAGCSPQSVLSDRNWAGLMTRFYGLDRGLGDA